MTIFDRRLKPYWRSYVFQSLLATVAVFMALIVMAFRQMIVISSLGATAFIVFVMPCRAITRTRNILGGHLMGFFCGWCFSLIPHEQMLLTAGIYALAVGVSIFLMVITETEHPPAAGTALGVAISGITFPEVFQFVLSILMLALVHNLLKSRMRDLI